MDMVRALAAYVDIAPSHGSLDERLAFQAGWDAAMKFMASPRIPAQPEYNCPPGGIPLPPEPLPPPPKEHNPHGLVAFYTDAPVKPWGHKEGHVDHPKGCVCGLCEQDAP